MNGRSEAQKSEELDRWLMAPHTQRLAEMARELESRALDALMRACESSVDPGVRAAKVRLDCSRERVLMLKEGKLL